MLKSWYFHRFGWPRILQPEWNQCRRLCWVRLSAQNFNESQLFMLHPCFSKKIRCRTWKFSHPFFRIFRKAVKLGGCSGTEPRFVTWNAVFFTDFCRVLRIIPIGSMYNIFTYIYQTFHDKCRSIFHTWILWDLTVFPCVGHKYHASSFSTKKVVTFHYQSQNTRERCDSHQPECCWQHHTPELTWSFSLFITFTLCLESTRRAPRSYKCK